MAIGAMGHETRQTICVAGHVADAIIQRGAGRALEIQDNGERIALRVIRVARDEFSHQW